MLENLVSSGRNSRFHSLKKNPFAVRLQDISVRFGKLWALKNIDFTIEKGEFLFLTGASGAGKTTLLNVLSGDLPPTEGKVFRCQEEQFITKVFQDLRLVEKLSCRDNLKLCYDSKVYKSQKEFTEELKQLAQIFNIESRLDIKICQANRGLKQKIAILRSLLSRPEVVLADEPTSSLDKDNAFQLFDLFNFYNSKREVTIIWASHNRELIKQFNGKIIHINQGRLIHAGHACFI